jgi:two-component system cell cycle sensor histidine kinase PleC
MGELTAQMVQRGRNAAPAEVLHRRKLTQEMRAVREKLTSSVGLERSFEYELLRLFAQYHLSAALLLLVLAGAIAAVASFWLPPGLAATWFLLMGAVLGAMTLLARRYLDADPDSIRLPVWRRRFAGAGLVVGGAWSLSVHWLTGLEAGGGSLVLFIVLMTSAMTAMLSATLPVATYLGVAPLAAVMVVFAAKSASIHALILLAMTACALAVFLLLADRLYRGAVATVQSRAEKDALFVELETAKANSDEARRRAEEANLAKSRFLATMSHELRTPLNAILGFSEVMKDEIFGPHATAAYRDYAGDIHGSGQHLLQLINEILDLSRIEAGRYELHEEAVQLAWIVGECSHMLNLRAKAKNQTLLEFIDPSLPRIWADERAVRQIVLNVLSNAIKFTPPGGEITIKVGWTSSGGQYLSVKDTGPGIPDEEIPVVMSSFGRGSLAIKTAEQGSGLGLPIVKGLVDIHNGGFQLKSKPREGTEVIVTFPAIRVMDTLAPVQVPAAPSRAA